MEPERKEDDLSTASTGDESSQYLGDVSSDADLTKESGKRKLRRKKADVKKEETSSSSSGPTSRTTDHTVAPESLTFEGTVFKSLEQTATSYKSAMEGSARKSARLQKQASDDSVSSLAGIPNIETEEVVPSTMDTAQARTQETKRKLRRMLPHLFDEGSNTSVSTTSTRQPSPEEDSEAVPQPVAMSESDDSRSLSEPQATAMSESEDYRTLSEPQPTATSESDNFRSLSEPQVAVPQVASERQPKPQKQGSQTEDDPMGE